MTRYTCPVCQFPAMEHPPEDYNICPSCGTEFGLDDANSSIENLREVWIAGGKKWWFTGQEKPQEWNP